MVRCGSAQGGVDSGLPSNYKKNKKLLKSNRNNAYENDAHASNLANLQRRLSSIGDVRTTSQF
jgi:hypothetical protein